MPTEWLGALDFASFARTDSVEIGRYEIICEIGHGGMATVHRARDTRLDREVALKVLHPHLRSSPDAKARFQREAKSVAKLRHPRILEIYDYSGDHEGDAYIASELLTGPTLRVFIEENGAMPAEIAAAVGIEMCQALALAHQENIVHRDVKPENILLHKLSDSVSLKLTDFGIAGWIDQGNLTSTGQILGSPYHMAPEQIEGGQVDGRTDIFALGTVLYYLSAAELPFVGKTPHQVLLRILEGENEPLIRANPHVGDAFSKLVGKCLRRDRDARFATVQDLEIALREFLQLSFPTDSHALLSSYLRSPNAKQKELESTIVQSELVQAKALFAASQDLDAGQHLSRALAYEPDNKEAQSLLATARKRRTQSRLTRFVLVACMSIAAVGAGVWKYQQNLAQRARELAAEAARTATVASPTKLTGNTNSPPDTQGASGAQALSAIDAQADASTLAMMLPVPIRGSDLRVSRDMPRPVRPQAQRMVAFAIDPVNTSISIDDGPPRPFGPDFQGTELSVGLHQVQVVSHVDCCSNERFSVEIPPGEDRFTLRHTLPSRPAILIVRSNVAADVSVNQGAVRGRARSPLVVPMARGERSISVPIEVTAEGYRAYTERVPLTAGRDSTIQVTLEPIS